jgi:hypothetical protein
MEADPPVAEIGLRQLGAAERFWFAGGLGPPFFTAATGKIRWLPVFSGRGNAASDHHIGQSKERVELMPVLGQTLIPHFPMAEQVLHAVEGMFHKRPLRRLHKIKDQRIKSAFP